MAEDQNPLTDKHVGAVLDDDEIDALFDEVSSMGTGEGYMLAHENLVEQCRLKLERECALQARTELDQWPERRSVRQLLDALQWLKTARYDAAVEAAKVRDTSNGNHSATGKLKYPL